MTLSDLALACFVFGIIDTDAYSRFQADTAPGLDLRDDSHRRRLLKFLNDWGCRHLALNKHETASAQLRKWWDRFDPFPVARQTTLLDLEEKDFECVEEVYIDLRDRIAGEHISQKGKRINVSFGPVAVAKTLFALRPNSLLPWDNPIMAAFGQSGSRGSYAQFLRHAQREALDLQHSCDRHGVNISDVPRLIGRPHSTLAKLIDEYYWTTITNNIQLPKGDDLDRWSCWRAIQPYLPRKKATPKKD